MNAKTWVVLMPSAISYRMCLLGTGVTKAEAQADAYGPKPWPKSARDAECREVDDDELDELRSNRATGGAL